MEGENGRKQPAFFCVLFLKQRIMTLKHFLAFSGFEQRLIGSVRDSLARAGQQLKTTVHVEQCIHLVRAKNN